MKYTPNPQAIEMAKYHVGYAQGAVDTYFSRSTDDFENRDEDQRRALEHLSLAVIALLAVVEKLDEAQGPDPLCGKPYLDLLDPSGPHPCGKGPGHGGNHGNG